MLKDEPIDLLLDDDGDLVVDQDVHLSTGLQAIAQGIRIAILLIRGEWFLNPEEGVPYFERDGVEADEALMAQRFDKRKAIQAFSEAIKSAPGVNELLSLDVSFDGKARKLSVRWAVRTQFGDTKPEETLIGVP